MSEANDWSLLRGVAEKPEPLHELRSGTSTICFENGDVRYYRVDGIEIVRRIYVAVRDVVWDTRRATVTPWELRSRGDSGYEASYSARVSDGDVVFEWTGRVEILPSGEMTYSMQGRALSEFDYARIGLCVLHPPSIAGRPFRAVTREGLLEDSLPGGIGPQPLVEGEYLPLMPAFSALAVDLGQGARARFEFEGDEFEIEDQRNWLDASYKSYSTPMALGVLHARPGQELFQQVRVKVTIPERPHHQHRDTTLPTRLELDRTGPRGTMPAIGLGFAPSTESLSSGQTALLAELGLDHLRVDVHLGGQDAAGELSRAARAALACRSGLEIALFVDDDADLELQRAKELLDGLEVPIRRFLVFGEKTLVTPGELTGIARRVLGGLAPVYGGTNIYFAELNRDRPDPASADGFAFSVNPQVHSSDDRSMMEAPPTLADMMTSARDFLGDSPIAVSPVTLLPRFNPDAPGLPGLEAPPADHRQASLLCATWTLQCATYLAQESAHSVTFFETSGERGVMAQPTVPAQPGVVVGGRRFPVSDILAKLAPWAGAQTFTVRSTDPLAAFGLACSAGDVLQVFVANATAETLQLQLGGLPEDACTLAFLDSETVARSRTGTATDALCLSEQVLDGPPLELDLAPYAIGVLSFEYA